jgi:SAM-dependent methyltransferase
LLFGRRNPNVKFLATDLSSRSLLYARIRCFAFGAWNVEFLKEDLSFSTRENEFCAIDAFGVLHHTENPRRSLELLVRALRKGGVLRIMLYSDTARAPFEKLREELLKEKPTWTDDELRQEIRSRGLSLTGELSNRSGRADALIHPLVKCFSESEVLDLLRDLSLEVLSQTKDGNHILYLRKTS